MKYLDHAFHIHTRRCGHAGNASDETYIKEALKLGYTGIWFSDHAPFPGDPFGNRMKYSELSEYVSSFNTLREKYQGQIEVHIGLEAEYFPSFHGYYEELLGMGMEFLLLGQHIYELPDGKFNFTLEDSRRKEEEAYGLADAMEQGLSTGLFAFCAHPDRMFRYGGDIKLSMKVIKASRGVILEKNIASMETPGYYNDAFWLLAGGQETVLGLDAHSPEELRRGTPVCLLKLLRKRYKMRQKDLSAFSGIPLSTVQDWEHGRRNPPPYILPMVMGALSGAAGTPCGLFCLT